MPCGAPRRRQIGGIEAAGRQRLGQRAPARIGLAQLLRLQHAGHRAAAHRRDAEVGRLLGEEVHHFQRVVERDVLLDQQPR